MIKNMGNKFNTVTTSIIAGLALCVFAAGCSSEDDFPETCGATSSDSLGCGDNNKSPEPIVTSSITEEQIEDFKDTVTSEIPSVINVEVEEVFEEYTRIYIYLPAEETNGLSYTEKEFIKETFTEVNPNYQVDIWEQWLTGFEEINNIAEKEFRNIVIFNEEEEAYLIASNTLSSPPDLDRLQYQDIKVDGAIIEEDLYSFVDEVLSSYGIYSLYLINVETNSEQAFEDTIEIETCLITPDGNTVFVTDNDTSTRFIFSESSENLYEYCQ